MAAVGAGGEAGHALGKGGGAGGEAGHAPGQGSGDVGGSPIATAGHAPGEPEPGFWDMHIAELLQAVDHAYGQGGGGGGGAQTYPPVPDPGVSPAGSPHHYHPYARDPTLNTSDEEALLRYVESYDPDTDPYYHLKVLPPSPPAQTSDGAVSYTHLTLPTKRIV